MPAAVARATRLLYAPAMSGSSSRAAFRPALFDSLRGYSARLLGKDLLAGATVGIVALPLAMAFAIAVGLEPIYGLMTGIVAGFLISALGGSKYQVGGPTGAFVVIIAGVLARHGYDGLVAATIAAGLILVVLSFLRVGRLIEYVPYPVTTGFTTGIGIIIFIQQLRDLLGLSIDSPSPEILGRIGEYVENIGSFRPWALGVGLATIGGIVLVRRVAPRLPAAALSIAVVTTLVALVGLPVETVADRFGELPAALPAPRLPSLSFAVFRDVLPDAVSIALLAGIESLLSAVVADGMTGDRHRSDIELFAQGIANIASVLFGGIPATGAIARTATNIKSGARSPIAGMTHAVTLLVLLLVAAPVAGRIPLAALAAVLIVVAWDMSEMHRFVRLLRAPRSDVLVLFVSFLLTVFVDLTVAVQVGVVLSAFLFMRRMVQVSTISTRAGAAAPEIAAVVDPGGAPGEDDPDEEDPRDLVGSLPGHVEVYEIDGPFFFGVASRLPDLLRALERPPSTIILRMRHVPAIDATGLRALEVTIRGFFDRGTNVILSGVQEQPARAMEAMGITELVGRTNVCASLAEALSRAQSQP